ncbi:MAG: ABC transporter ATP-binding protein [Spirochaetales bacterium]|nr:ABC transporter ATP-binding protein [Spirochaetales bacterium]
MSAILSVRNVSMQFGALMANKDVSFDVEPGTVVGLIGPNGAGKTTLFNCVAGFYKPSAGSILFHGEDITGMPSYRVARKGLARTFQVVRPLKEMTVLENIMVGAYMSHGDTKRALAFAEECMRTCFLEEWRDKPSGDMTIGNKKRLEIARALATGPKMLLLDEAVAGLTSTEVKEMVDVIKRLKATGLTILMVEHIMEAIMPIADKIVVLAHGEKIAEGIPGDVVRNNEVITAYLGKKYAEGMAKGHGSRS